MSEQIKVADFLGGHWRARQLYSRPGKWAVYYTTAWDRWTQALSDDYVYFAPTVDGDGDILLTDKALALTTDLSIRLVGRTFEVVEVGESYTAEVAV